MPIKRSTSSSKIAKNFYIFSQFWPSGPIQIVLIYAICHFPLLLLWDAKYWDDWLIFGMADDSLFQTFSEAGFSWMGHLHSLMRVWGAPFYKITTFLMMGIPPLACYKILVDLNYPLRRALWVSILVTVLPFFFSRVVAINIPSVICNAIFFSAWALLLADASGLRERIYLAISLLLFAISFSYHSLASLYLVVLYTYGYKRRFDFYKYTIPKKILRIGLLLVPLITFVIQRLIFSPSGNYREYNSINLDLINLLMTLFHTAGELLNPATPAGAFFLFFLLPIFLGGVYCAVPRRHAWLGRLRFYGLAYVAIVFILMPYIVAGKHPSFIDWGSRLQLLFPIGFALLVAESNQRVCAYVRLHSSLRLSFIMPGCVIFSIFLWWTNYIEYEVDWMKQVSIVNSIKSQKSFEDYNTFIVVDEALSLNVHARSYRFYEVAGMLREAGINKVQLVSTNFEVQSAARDGVIWTEFRKRMEPYLNEQYLLEKSLQPERVAILTISSVPAAGVSKVFLLLKSWKLRIMNEKKYKQSPLDLVIVTIYQNPK